MRPLSFHCCTYHSHRRCFTLSVIENPDSCTMRNVNMNLKLIASLTGMASLAVLGLQMAIVGVAQEQHQNDDGHRQATSRPTLNPTPPTSPAIIRVDTAVRHQTMEGFGATTLSLAYGGFDYAGYDDEDNLPALRAKAIEAVYGQVRLSMGNLEPGTLEQRGNDDNDPMHIESTGFDWRESRFLKEKIVDLARPYGFDNYSLAPMIDFRRMGWLKAIRSTDYNRFLDECAEHVVAEALYWRDTLKTSPRTMFLFNEPLSGNGELQGGGIQEVVDITKRAGARMQAAGLAIKFVVGNEETEAKSLEVATAILSDPKARSYVAAIGYHPYPYGSPYASIPHIFHTSGQGRPDASRIEIRRKLKELAQRYAVQLWMSEVSHGEVPLESMDALRGRAIHIHDELEYADANAYFGMNAMWDSKTHQEHTKGSRLLESETDTIALIDNEAGKVIITGMGYAIGHYARWIQRGAVRVEALVSDPLVQATAFVDTSRRRIALVIVNNYDVPRSVTATLNGATFKGNLSGEQSFGTVRWRKLPASAPGRPNSFTITLPQQSVTSLAGSY